MAERVPVTVVETPEFLTAARKIMSEEDRIELVVMVGPEDELGPLVRFPPVFQELLSGPVSPISDLLR